jgi:hypothetical protein
MFRNNKYSNPRELIMKKMTNHLGYKRVSVSKHGVSKTFQVHRLVMQAFTPNPENKRWVNHKDFNPSNNCVENLEWCTPSENNNYTIKAGRAVDNKGESHPNSKLTESQVKRIRLMKEIDPTITKRTIARLFGVEPSNIGYILLRKTWTHI